MRSDIATIERRTVAVGSASAGSSKSSGAAEENAKRDDAAAAEHVAAGEAAAEPVHPRREPVASSFLLSLSGLDS